MTDYVSNTPISAPIQVSNAKVDVDLNGMKFSYDIGFFFTDIPTQLPLRLPPPYATGAGQ